MKELPAGCESNGMPAIHAGTVNQKNRSRWIVSCYDHTMPDLKIRPECGLFTGMNNNNARAGGTRTGAAPYHSLRPGYLPCSLQASRHLLH